MYLLAGAYAALSVPLWALQYLGWLPGADPLWHAHRSEERRVGKECW